MIDLISSELNLKYKQVQNVLQLHTDGGSIPFITRYRKEQTGNLNELQIGSIIDLQKKYTELNKRRESILTSLTNLGIQDKLLLSEIHKSTTLQKLEDLYAPYRPKRKTRASVAIEHGLKPLAEWIWSNPYREATDMAYRFTTETLSSEQDAIQGALDIIAEQIADDSVLKGKIRRLFERKAIVKSKVVQKKKDEDEAQVFREYFDFSVAIKKIASHTIHALLRGKNQGVLKVSILPESNDAIQNILTHLKLDERSTLFPTIEDSYKRLIRGSLEKELLHRLKQQADQDAITIFSSNLKQLLLESPLGKKRVLALDPGFRTGCKAACLDHAGQLLDHTVIYPTGSQRQEQEARNTITHLIETHHIEAIAIGNGTASRETERFVRNLQLNLIVQVVNESGASIYSVSEIAREEFPTLPETIRSAISIGRRFQDPLAELVKIDAKSLGIGQYQHDVDQKQLNEALDRVVESAVNHVGVNINSTSKELLTYVSGINNTLTRNIIKHRELHGEFKSRNDLKLVKGMGAKSFEQAAGFLRITDGENPLDNTGIHPESYPLVSSILAKEKLTIDSLQDVNTWKTIPLELYTNETVGLETLQDIKTELQKPGRDPREQFKEFSFANGVNKISDLQIGMVLPGIVSNITKFGAFVDIGVHQDGLVHISQISDQFVSDINEELRLRQEVQVKVLEVDETRKRISLTMCL